MDWSWFEFLRTSSEARYSYDFLASWWILWRKLERVKLLPLKKRREPADMIQTFKILQGFNDVNPASWFTRINHIRLTRNATDPLNLEIQISRTNVRSNFYSVRVNQKMELDSIRHQRIFYCEYLEKKIRRI